MLENILADAFNGFSFNDLPFLFIQLSVSALMAWLLRLYWLKADLSGEEAWLTRLTIPLQITLTLLAVFSQRSPWVAVVFGFSLLIVATAGNQLSLRSRIFFTLNVIAAWGFGSGNMVVTLLVFIILVWPMVHMGSSVKK